MPLLDRPLGPAAVLAVGVVLSGALIGNGFARGHRDDRFVTVKGISEREAKADLAIWPLRIGAADNDLGRAHDRLVTSAHLVLQFLARNALDTTAATVQDLSVTDEFLEGAATNHRGRATSFARPSSYGRRNRISSPPPANTSPSS